MNIKIIFPLILFFTLTGCSTIGDIKSWAFDEDQEQLETVINFYYFPVAQQLEI